MRQARRQHDDKNKQDDKNNPFLPYLAHLKEKGQQANAVDYLFKKVDEDYVKKVKKRIKQKRQMTPNAKNNHALETAVAVNKIHKISNNLINNVCFPIIQFVNMFFFVSGFWNWDTKILQPITIYNQKKTIKTIPILKSLVVFFQLFLTICSIIFIFWMDCLHIYAPKIFGDSNAGLYLHINKVTETICVIIFSLVLMICVFYLLFKDKKKPDEKVTKLLIISTKIQTVFSAIVVVYTTFVAIFRYRGKGWKQFVFSLVPTTEESLKNIFNKMQHKEDDEKKMQHDDEEKKDEQMIPELNMNVKYDMDDQQLLLLGTTKSELQDQMKSSDVSSENLKEFQVRIYARSINTEFDKEVVRYLRALYLWEHEIPALTNAYLLEKRRLVNIFLNYQDGKEFVETQDTNKSPKTKKNVDT